MVSVVEDFSDDLKDQIKDIPEYYYKAFVVKIHTALMGVGVFDDTDGRLKKNAKSE